MWLGKSGGDVLFFVHGNLAPKDDASETLVAQQGSDCEKGWDDWGDLGGQGSSQLGRSGRLTPLVWPIPCPSNRRRRGFVSVR